MQEIEKIRHFTRLINITAFRRLSKFLYFTILSKFYILCNLFIIPCKSCKYHYQFPLPNFMFRIKRMEGIDREGGGDGAGEMETRERRSVSIVWLIAENGSREGECLSGS